MAGLMLLFFLNVCEKIMPAVCACEVVRHFARGQEQDFKGLAMVMTSLAQTQCQIFLEGDGDRWFDRNRSTLSQQKSFYESETIKRVLASHRDRIGHILEIGCGNGVKLADLSQFFAAQGHGIDPSAEAVREGMDKFPNINVQLDVSIALHIPHGDASMDLVYFGFCLYLVDRTEILKAVAEADRVLKSGGFLAILDFDPGYRHKRTYHHKPGLFPTRRLMRISLLPAVIIIWSPKTAFSKANMPFRSIAMSVFPPASSTKNPSHMARTDKTAVNGRNCWLAAMP